MMKKAIIICLFLKITVSHAQQSDLNLSFEKLDTNGRLIGWNSTIEFIVDDAYDGNRAFKIFTYYVNLPSTLRLGSVRRPITSARSYKGGVPFTKKPIKLKGYYKYEYGNNCGGKDSAEVNIYLRRFNTLSNESDTIGSGKLYLGPSPIYKLFEVPVIYNSQIDPDSLSIEFVSEHFDTTVKCNTSNNRFFTIDALSFDFATPTEDIKNLKSPITINPNPTSNSIQIDWGENSVSDIVLKDTLGRIIQKKAVNTEGVNLDLSSLPIGLYFIEFNQNGKHLATRKVVKQ